MFIKDTLSITPLQHVILRHIRQRRAVPAQTLATELERMRDTFALSKSEWNNEIEMQCRLFDLHGLVRVDTHMQPRPLYIATSLLLRWKPKTNSSELPQDLRPHSSLKHITACLMSSSLVLSGCSSLSWQRATPDLSSGARPLPRYHADGWLPPERMEQFTSPGKGAVYRFCTDDCPDPTPKVPRIASAGNTAYGKMSGAPVHEYVATPIPLMAHSAEEVILAQQDAEMEAMVAEAEAYLREHPPKAAMAAITNALPYQQRADRNAVPVINSTPPPPVYGSTGNSLKPTQKPTTPEQLSRLTPTSQRITSVPSRSEPPAITISVPNNGVVFSATRSTLDEDGMRAVADLAEGVQQAEKINLRGYAAPISPTDREEFQQLSIARALSVRKALTEAGIDPSKIRILSAKYQHIDPSNVLAAANRSVMVSLKMSDGKIIKPRVQAAAHPLALAQLPQRATQSNAALLMEPTRPMVSHRHIENYSGSDLPAIQTISHDG